MICRPELKNHRGSLVVDGLVSAAVIGVIIVALFGAFGKSTDSGAVASDYVVAVNVAQKYLEILKTKEGNSAFWTNLTTTGYPTEPNILWDNQDTVAATQTFAPESGNGFVITLENFGHSGQTVRVYAYTYTSAAPESRKIARCKSEVTWTPSTVTGTNVSGSAKSYSLYLENDYYMTP